MRSPGASERYRDRDDLFPSLVFGRAYDPLGGAQEVRKAEVEYVRILHLAALTMETDVEQALYASVRQRSFLSSSRVEPR